MATWFGDIALFAPELTTDQWAKPNGSTNLDGSRGSWVICDPLTHDPLTDD